MRRYLLILSMLVIAVVGLNAQSIDMFRGNNALEKGDFEKAENFYQSAAQKQSNLFEAQYNLGCAAYKKGDFETAKNQFQLATSLSQSTEDRAKAYHNLGNSQLQAKNYAESVQSYKESLKLNPTDNETRYNLAYAQKMLKKEQEKENQQDQNKEQKQDKGDNQDKKDQNQKDDDQNNDKNKQQKENDKKESQNGKDQKQEKGEQKQPKPVNISPREAEKLLEAAKEEDQKLQMQLHKQTKKSNPKTIDKDW